MSDDEENLRDRLHAIDVPPSRIRPDDLVPAGRRMAFRRRGAQTAGAVAIVTSVLLAVPTIVDRVNAAPGVLPAASPAASRAATGPVVTPGPPSVTPSTGNPSVVRTPSSAKTKTASCTATELKSPAGVQKINLAGVDPTGRFIIGNGLAGQGFRPVLWTDGVPRQLPRLAESVELTDVNSSGTVVGQAETGAQSTIFRYADGRYTKLKLPPGNWNPYPEPRINLAGDVLINIKPRGVSNSKNNRAIMWRAGQTDAVQLPLPSNASAYDLDDMNRVAGGLYDHGNATSARLWLREEVTVALNAPPGKVAMAYAIHGRWATGGLWPASGGSDGTAVLWEYGKGVTIDLGGTSPGIDVNDKGWVVTLDGKVLRPDTVTTVLEVPGSPNGAGARAEAITDTGLVVGESGGSLYAWRC